MAVMASWGPKRWEMSPQKITHLQGLSTSVKLKAESNNDTSGTPPINTKGVELIPISCSTDLHAVAGVDVRREIEEWEALVGEVYPFYLGGTRFGPAQMQLQSVSASNYVVNHWGEVLSATVSIELLEYQPTETKSYSSGLRGGGTSSGMASGGQTATSTSKSKAAGKASKMKQKSPPRPGSIVAEKLIVGTLSTGLAKLKEQMKR